MKSRVTIVFIFFAALWILILSRAAFLQVVPNNRLSQLEKREFETTVTLQSRRGAILDRAGRELAVSMRSFSLFADPHLIERPRALSRQLAKALNQSPEFFYKILSQKSRRFVWIQRHMDDAAKETISNWKVRGIGFIEESQRVYPSGSLLANVLGFVGKEGQGLEGLEARFDEKLQNRHLQITVPRDARGRPLVVNGQFFAENLDGSNIELTIDQELQFVLERELQQAAQRHEADAAMGIVMDAKTNEILAMAQTPTFDPNAPNSSEASARRNRVIADAFEPGSTMKTFVMAGAIAAKKIAPNTKIDCQNGQLKIGGRIIREADAHEKFKILTASEILAFSSNVGITKIAFDFGPEGVFNTLKNFGFGEKTGVELPGEAKGIFHSLPWGQHQFSNISFGQGISTTALQIANAYAAIANGGWLRKPRILRRITDPVTGDTQEFKTENLRRVLSQHDAEQLTLMLSTVTAQGGTGVNARVPGFPVAGKTGTAQKVRADGRGYYSNAYLSSFAGFVPANDPQFVIYIVVDNPRKGYYGAAVAAPVFSKVAAFALRQASVAPVLISEKNLLPAPTQAPVHPQPDLNPANDSGLVPDLVGLSLRDALRRIHGSPIDLRAVGTGRVVRSEPPPHSPIPADAKMTVFLESDHE